MKKQLLKLSATVVLLALFSVNYAAHVLPIRTMVIPLAYDVVTIDGAADEAFWSAVQTTDAFNKTGCATYPDADLTVAFKVCYDAEYLYLWSEIKDDTDNSTPDNGATNPWTFDNVEPFFDLDTNNSGVVTAYDSNTIQLRVNRGMDSVQTFGRTTRAAYQLYWENTSDGWLFEVAIPWKAVLAPSEETADIMPFFDAGMVSGFDMGGADSDAAPGTPDLRDCQTAWDNDDPSDDADRTEDNAWNNRSVFGFITFEPLGDAIDNTTTTSATVYPNPTSGLVTITNISGVTSVEVMNIAGQVVSTQKFDGTVDMSQLESGIYFIKAGNNVVKVSVK
jgi:hypothetical protein